MTTTWKRFPNWWPFVRRIHQSPVNSPHGGSVIRNSDNRIGFLLAWTSCHTNTKFEMIWNVMTLLQPRLVEKRVTWYDWLIYMTCTCMCTTNTGPNTVVCWFEGYLEQFTFLDSKCTAIFGYHLGPFRLPVCRLFASIRRSLSGGCMHKQPGIHWT